MDIDRPSSELLKFFASDSDKASGHRSALAIPDPVGNSPAIAAEAFGRERRATSQNVSANILVGIGSASPITSGSTNGTFAARSEDRLCIVSDADPVL